MCATLPLTSLHISECYAAQALVLPASLVALKLDLCDSAPGEQLAGLTQLQRLTIICDAADEDCAFDAQLRSAAADDALAMCAASKDGWCGIAGLQSLTALEALPCDGCRKGEPVAMAHILRSLPQLAELRYWSYDADDSSHIVCEALGPHTGLRELRFTAQEPFLPFGRKPSRLGAMRLTALHLRLYQAGPPAEQAPHTAWLRACCAQLAQLPQLKVCIVDFDDEEVQLEAVQPLTGATRLHALELHFDSVISLRTSLGTSTVGLQEIAALTQLTCLSLQVVCAPMLSLQALASMPHLQVLKLLQSGVVKPTQVRIEWPPLFGFSQLTELHLYAHAASLRREQVHRWFAWASRSSLRRIALRILCSQQCGDALQAAVERFNLVHAGTKHCQLHEWEEPA